MQHLSKQQERDYSPDGLYQELQRDYSPDGVYEDFRRDFSMTRSPGSCGLAKLAKLDGISKNLAPVVGCIEADLCK